MDKLTRLATAEEYKTLQQSKWNTIQIKLDNGSVSNMCKTTYDLRVLKEKFYYQGVSEIDIAKIIDCAIDDFEDAADDDSMS